MSLKLLLSIVFVFGLNSAANLFNNTKELFILEYQFQNWAKQNDKTYHSKEDSAYRFSIYLQSLLEIQEHNASGSSYRKGINKFADLTDDEFLSRYTTNIPVQRPENYAFWKPVYNFFISIFSNLLGFNKKPYHVPRLKKKMGSFEIEPKNIDWEAKGAVTSVKNQMNCGGCYAFAIIGAIESAYKIKTGNLKDFSEQYIIDCGPNSGIRDLQGCGGGSLIAAAEFSKRFGVVSQKEVPFIGYQQNCNSKAKVEVKIADYSFDTKYVDDLLANLKEGPIAVSIEITPDYKLYQEGVMEIKYPCGFFVNHAVLVVGYDSTAIQPYFKFKNSWGEGVGESGYFKVPMFAQEDSGFCGLTILAVRPILN